MTGRPVIISRAEREELLKSLREKIKKCRIETDNRIKEIKDNYHAQMKFATEEYTALIDQYKVLERQRRAIEYYNNNREKILSKAADYYAKRKQREQDEHKRTQTEGKEFSIGSEGVGSQNVR